MRRKLFRIAITIFALSTTCLVAVRSGPAKVNRTLSEPAELYSPDGAGLWAVALVDIANREARRGNLPAAIEAMQMAANAMAQQRNTNFELWDNLAELYCAQARRDRVPARAAAAQANGIALIREFRCAVKHYEQNTPNACFTEGGPLPNTDMTPLCYTVLCTQSPRTADRRVPDLAKAEEYEIERRAQPLEEDYSYYHFFREDAANLRTIEAVCHATDKRDRRQKTK
jgi:hypothetical protein